MPHRANDRGWANGDFRLHSVRKWIALKCLPFRRFNEAFVSPQNANNLAFYSAYLPVTVESNLRPVVQSSPIIFRNCLGLIPSRSVSGFDDVYNNCKAEVDGAVTSTTENATTTEEVTEAESQTEIETTSTLEPFSTTPETTAAPSTESPQTEASTPEEDETSDSTTADPTEPSTSVASDDEPEYGSGVSELFSEA